MHVSGFTQYSDCKNLFRAVGIINTWQLFSLICSITDAILSVKRIGYLRVKS